MVIYFNLCKNTFSLKLEKIKLTIVNSILNSILNSQKYTHKKLIHV